MNSLNLLSARVIGQARSEVAGRRARSASESKINNSSLEKAPKRSFSQVSRPASSLLNEKQDVPNGMGNPSDGSAVDMDEKTPLLQENRVKPEIKASGKLKRAAKRVLDAITASLKWVLSTIAAPGVYVVTCLYDKDGNIRIIPRRKRSKPTKHQESRSIHDQDAEKPRSTRSKLTSKKSSKRRPLSTESLSAATSESELDLGEIPKTESILRAHSHRGSSSSSDDAPRRSIRIKVKNEDPTVRRKARQSSSSTSTTTSSALSETAAQLKSPTSPSSSLRITKYPRSPAPPRPLIPLHQPSYNSLSRSPQKTLVIDLDETLIHSLAKGGRMSSGHMVEVKLAPIVSTSSGQHSTPQHPILYYVHKRPHCDTFLRKVSAWFRLVAFTASVQEYADPVIDWLEQEKTFFERRYYRQHCTFRGGAYIKDLSSVEPDLSRVCILDNSPLSYIFHEGEILQGFSAGVMVS